MKEETRERLEDLQKREAEFLEDYEDFKRLLYKGLITFEELAKKEKSLRVISLIRQGFEEALTLEGVLK